MPDLATELSHLEQAEAHIAQAHANIARFWEQMAAKADSGIELRESAGLLDTLKVTLEAFQHHRALIVQTIDDIKAGKFA